jgi:hypothetical protein
MSEVKGRITVSQFAERYSKLASDQLKDKYVKEHVKTTYSPILNKINVLNLMNEKSVVDSPTGKYIDMSVSKLNLVMAILVLYTDIEPDKSEDGKSLTWEAYDALKSTGLYGKLLNTIGEDLEELMSVQSNVMDTWYNKNCSTQAYIANLVESASHKIGVISGAGMDKLADVLGDEVKMKKVASTLDKVLKKIK